jgi:hypothetical protein
MGFLLKLIVEGIWGFFVGKGLMVIVKYYPILNETMYFILGVMLTYYSGTFNWMSSSRERERDIEDMVASI